MHESVTLKSYSQNMTYPEYICLCPEGATGYRCQVQCGGQIRNEVIYKLSSW